MQHFASAVWLCIVGGVVAIAAHRAVAEQVVVDNADAGGYVETGSWTTGTFPIPWSGSYRFADTGATPTATARWTPTLASAGDYQVEVWYVSGGNRAVDAPFVVTHAGGSTPVPVNQQVNGSQWVMLGTFPFTAGTGGFVELSNQANPSVVIADAVRFTPAVVAEEFRGMWISRFEWPSTSLATVQSRLSTFLGNLQTHRFNAVVLQVRGQCDTLYPSPYESWSPLVSADGNAPSGWGGFDPLQYAIEQAHARGLEFHAYINTHVGWQSAGGNPPTYNLNHVFWDHLNAADPAARDWLIHDATGSPQQFEESGYVWIAPGVPAAQAYTRAQVMHVVNNYDVDGVHYDRIRTPGLDYSYDPISQARRLGDGNPDGLDFEDWTRDQITRFTRDLYAQIMEVKPWIKVSSAPLGLYRGDRYPGYPTSACGYFYGYSCVMQDAQAWLAAGAQDFIVPQIYWADGGGNPDFSEILPDWIANNAGRHIYAGQTTGNGLSALLDQIGATRALGGEGNVVFSYSGINNGGYWSSYSDVGGPYAQAADVPGMPWKENPTTGVILGNVTDVNTGAPIVDAHVTRSGSTYTALSSGDGLYSFLLVPPGSYTLTFDKPGVGQRVVGDVQILAGEATRVDVALGGPPLPCDVDHDGDVDAEDLKTFVFCISGPEGVYPPGAFCAQCDADADLDVDLIDFQMIQEVGQP